MATIDRISPDDAMALATDVGAVPMQVGAVLVLGGEVDPAELAQRLTERLPAIPRLRQRLQPVPFGVGRPPWVDHEGFRLAEHLVSDDGPPPDRDALLELVARTVCRPLDRSRPLWRIVLVPRLDGGGAAVIVVFHHVLADGIGGLAVLAHLVDGASPTPDDPSFPRPAPTVQALRRDVVGRLGALLTHPVPALRRVRDALVQLRPSGAGRVARTSLNSPTGARRQLLTAAVPLDPLHRAARAHGATVNDALLCAVGGALGDVLADRGESVSELVVSMPMSSRREASGAELGNEVGAVPVRVPIGGPPAQRLETIARRTAEARRTTRAASTAIIGPVFRVLSRLGIFGWFVDHQHLVHTFVTNLRGPDRPLALLGVPIEAVHAVAMITGNVTASFAALSYAGSMGLTIIVDPETCQDATSLRDRLQSQLEAISSL